MPRKRIEDGADTVTISTRITLGLRNRIKPFTENESSFIRHCIEHRVSELEKLRESVPAPAYQTLIRVLFIDGDIVCVVIPGWNPESIVRIPLSNIPSELYDKLETGTRLMAYVTLGVDSADKLVIDRFDLAPTPEPGYLNT